jgi:hypothetical protein
MRKMSKVHFKDRTPDPGNNERMNHYEYELEIDRLKSCLAYLASCNAATLEGLPARTSKSERSRLIAICQKSATFLEGESPQEKVFYRSVDKKVTDAINRCWKAVSENNEPKPAP